jgi:predicted RND superfamily exporter protein
MNRTTVNAVPVSLEYLMNGDSSYGYQIGYHTYSQSGNGFSNATDDDLYYVLDDLFEIRDSTGTNVYKEMLSAELNEQGGSYSAPVMMIFIAVDNSVLEINYTYESSEVNGKKLFEDFELHVLEILQDNIETCNVYGVGLGIETEINNEIMESGPYIMFTFIVIIIILAITFKNNPKSFLAAAISLPLIIFWMKGTERLLDLSVTQFNAFLPILIMALGVDYAIHSMKRFEEELVKGKSPRNSVKGSVLKLTGTLALAMLTTMIAFFSNVFSTIPALADWGFEAGLAIVWTFVIMGIFTPALRLGFESSKSRDKPFYEHSQNKKAEKEDKEQQKRKAKFKKLSRNRLGSGLTKMTFSSISHPGIVVAFIILLVVPLGYGALNLGTNFEVEEFFNKNSDFVVGLNLYTDHFPEGGEPNILLIKGDIAEPAVLEAIDETRTLLDARGYATWYVTDVALMVQNFTENLQVNNMIGGNSITITDTDSNNFPDTRAEVHAILKQISQVGLWRSANGQPFLYIRPDFIQEVVHYDQGKDMYDKTIMAIGVSGSGSLDNIKEGIDNIRKDSEIIENTGSAEIVITGSGALRYDQLTAISESLKISIVVSIILCFIVLVAVFRKLAFSVVAILPVILIAIWLYGIMHFTGYNLNVITASIGAMSIGVGVDYSIHVCNRFRKEKAEGQKFDSAMQNTIANSGTALLFAALTTSFGFFMMLLAPMPMFFSFGLFSGIMVIFAFIASVIVVPPLIKLIERKS